MKKVDQVFAELLHKYNDLDIKSIDRLPGSLNCEAYKIKTSSGQIYLGKKYLSRKNDNRDRLTAEYGGLMFLWKNGIRQIPEPICCDKKEKMAIFSYIEGRKMDLGEISWKEVEDAANFLGCLNEISKNKDAKMQPEASEACFSISEYIEIINKRLSELNKIKSDSLKDFIGNEFEKAYVEIKDYVQEQAKLNRVKLKEKIKDNERTLSPSDFGFHNVIKGSDGKFYYIDFEYFGWDDPAKTIADFYLQPAVPIPVEFREKFFGKIYETIGGDNNLIKRLPLVHAILGLKWCLIMLNVFLSYGSDVNRDRIIYAKQLEKAKAKLESVMKEYHGKTFPFSLAGV